MGNAYKLLYVLRPLIWGLFAVLIGVFGNRFYRKLLSVIGVVLSLIALGGAAVSTYYISYLLNYGSSQQEMTYAIVAVVMTIMMTICAIGYLLTAKTIDVGDGKVIKNVNAVKDMLFWGKILIIPIAFMGFSLPLFLLDETIGIVIGAVIEIFSFVILIAIVRAIMISTKSKKSKEE